VLVDEAHRLNEKSGLFSNLGENQIMEIIHAAKCSVFFIDESQRVTLKDIGSVAEIEKWAEIEGSEVTKMELVSQLSHDIKTPVASIKALGELLEAQSTYPKSKERLGSIVTKADNIDAMVSDLFTETLTELNELNVETSEQESRILDRIIKDADHMDLVTGRNVEECIIKCDPLRVTQVVNNIIFNSYKYADTMINVTSRFENAGSKYLFIEIADKGPGVPEEELEMITQKFKRGSNAGNKDGSGLGLYISDYLMNKMEGSLTVRNTGDGFAVEIGIKIS
jgi:signal transduction histidine kinase